MSKSIISLPVAGAILAILLTGCSLFQSSDGQPSDAETPAPLARTVPSPTSTATPAVAPAPTATPTPTSAPTNTPTPEPTPATATLPLGVYLTLCAPTDIDLADDATYGDLSSELAAEADRLEALTPPVQLSEWHLLNIEAYRTAQAGVDTQPKDDVMVDNPTINAVESAFVEKLREAAARVPKDILQQMIEAGCIDPDSVPDDHEDVPDDHGNDIDDATVAAVGADVEGALDYDDDIDYFRFQAEQGESYQIDVALGTLDDSIVDLYDVDGSFLDSNDDYGDTYASRLYWEAPSSGERYVLVGGYGTGTYTLTVSLIVDDHGNSEGDATAIRVGTDVRGALDYDDDIDFFRFKAERGQSYQIDVALGTLDDSIVDLYDADGSFLDSNDDYGDTYASRLYWEAPSSGERYIAVEGYGVGTYTLTVSIVDDHGDTAEDGVGVASDRAALVALYNATEGGSWATSTNWLSGRPLDEWHGVTTDSGGRVTALNLVSNRLVGALPAALGDLTNLRTLILWSNDELTGPIPAWLGDLTNLRWLILGGNGLTGEIPPELAGLSNLTSLDLRSNGLTGEIPPELAGLSNLQRLYLNHNRLTGEIPPELASLSNLTELYLSDNRLTGEIPPELGRLSNLMELGLYANQLTGEIPPELAGLSNLTSLILNSNRLTGGIPPELGGLSNLDFLWLRGNQLTGCIPEGLRDIEANDLGHLNLPDCGLEGRPTASSFVSVSAGESHTCGVKSDGSVVCWGNDEYGEATPPAGSFVSVSAGGSHTCGVRSDGSVACWGSNYWNSDYSGQSTPPTGSFNSVSAGEGHTCGVRSDGSVACWGDDWAGQATPPAGSFVSVSAGYDHTCGVRSDGSVACWGYNGDGAATPPAGSFVSVSAGWAHTCGVRSDGSVACWGYNGEGRATPPAGSFVSVSAGYDHTCGVRSDGSVACWGGNWTGAATPPAGPFVSVSAGGEHTCGMRSDGSVACWGNNDYGQSTPTAGSFSPTPTPADPTPAPTATPLPPPPDSLGLDPFYKKYLDADNLPIVSSAEVPNSALFRARDIIDEMLVNRPDLRATIAEMGVRVAIMAESEVTTDIPEHSDLYEAFPSTDWNARARGLSATRVRPATSAAEENLLCYGDDAYRNEDILVHEFAHTVPQMGVEQQPKGTAFRTRLEAAYEDALDAGLWAGTYAAEHTDEYWAEAVQSWFGVNDWAIPTNGIHNHINTRHELEAYDPRIADLIEEVFGETTISSTCHTVAITPPPGAQPSYEVDNTALIEITPIGRGFPSPRKTRSSWSSSPATSCLPIRSTWPAAPWSSLRTAAADIRARSSRSIGIPTTAASGPGGPSRSS